MVCMHQRQDTKCRNKSTSDWAIRLLLQSDVKKRVESLIDREYLQRTEHGYEYLA